MDDPYDRYDRTDSYDRTDRTASLHELWPSGPHRLPAPQAEPPYDETDEVAEPARPAFQGTLALSFPVSVGLPAPAGRPAPLRLVPPDPDHDPDADPEPDGAPEPGREPGGLPDAVPWARKIGQAIVEVLAGTRPTTQLLPWTTDRVYRQVSARVAAAPQAAAGHLGTVRVGSVRVTRPSPAVAEVTVVADDGVRSRAVALRLEASRGRWLCTAVEPAW